MIELILQAILAASSVIMATSFIATLVSRKLRLRIIRSFIGDFADLNKFSEMGKTSGDKRFHDKVQGIVRKNMPTLVGRLISENPFVAKGIEFFINETEIGELIEDPRTLGALLEMFQGGNLSDLLNQTSATPQQKQQITEGFRIG